MRHGQKASGQKKMSATEMKAVAAHLGRVIDARVSGDVDVLMSIFAEEAEVTIIGMIAGQPMVPKLNGAKEIRGFYHGFFLRWDWSGMQVVRRLFDGRFAAVEMTGRVLHRVSGQAFDTSTCDLLEFDGGRIVSARCYSDTFTIVRIAGLAY